MCGQMTQRWHSMNHTQVEYLQKLTTMCASDTLETLHKVRVYIYIYIYIYALPLLFIFHTHVIRPNTNCN